ncbi:MAG TPA: BrnT family toxin [Anaerolineae bacterium]|nr:BrnT family toxin [Anaerolineae bacterium]
MAQPETLFLWHPDKARANLKKHGVDFAEAKTVFQDPYAQIMYDPDHSDDEHRQIIIGYSNKNHLLFVSFHERDDVIRIISARKADSKERKLYEEKDY